MNEQLMRPEEELMQTLSAAPAILSRFVGGIPADRLEVRRKPHFWTIRDHVSHLAEVQPMLTKRLERFRDEDEPNFIPYLPSDDAVDETVSEPLSVERALAAFTEERRRLVALIREMPDEVWSKKGRHPEFELYTPPILVRHIAMHDHWHMYRMEELWLTRDEFLTEVS